MSACWDEVKKVKNGNFLPLPIRIQQLSYIGNITSCLPGTAGNELERVDEDRMTTGGCRAAPCLCIYMSNDAEKACFSG